MLSDELLSTAIGGDRDALGELLKQLDPELRQHVRAKLPARFRAQLDEQDVLQVTYLEAFLDIRSFQSGETAKFAAWLRRVADNNLNDAVRHLEAAKNPQPEKNLTHQVATDESYWRVINELTSGGSTASSTATKKEAKDRLEEFLTALPEDYETVLRLAVFAEKPIREVAIIMGRSEGAVSMLKARAWEHLDRRVKAVFCIST